MKTRSLMEMNVTQDQLLRSIDNPELLLQGINGATKQDTHKFLSEHFAPNTITSTKAQSFLRNVYN